MGPRGAGAQGWLVFDECGEQPRTRAARMALGRASEVQPEDHDAALAICDIFAVPPHLVIPGERPRRRSWRARRRIRMLRRRYLQAARRGR